MLEPDDDLIPSVFARECASRAVLAAHGATAAKRLARVGAH